VIARGPALLAAFIVAGLSLTACTSNSPAGRSTVTTVITTTTVPNPTPTTPVESGPTTSADAASCPWVTQDFVKQTIGMRLARIAVLRTGGGAGTVVGCRFYALQNDPLAVSEHLPGPNQPAVEIVTQRYPDAVAAHNAFVVTAEAGSNLQQVPVNATVTAVCFQTNFDPVDHGTDYACAVSKNDIELVVRSVDTTGALSTSIVLKAIYASI
jgi:hypothetical protein